ncbi:MAG: cytochrome c-type biogenesis protein [Litorimonas sp.]
MTIIFKSILSLIMAFMLASPVIAQSQSEYPYEIETRARDVGKQLRCVVCQNQSIEESDAPLAADMRKMVRERLVAGDSEADVVALMRDRYGDYVLLMPPVQGNTIILWAGPALLIGFLLLWWIVSVRRNPESGHVAALSEGEEAKLAALRELDQ